jgi:hypothetical protein
VEQPRIPPTEYVVTDLEPSRSFTWVATAHDLLDIEFLPGVPQLVGRFGLDP